MYYVTMTDKFMSGWGPARNKVNKLVISCSTYARAEIAERKANARSEMKYVNLCSKKPYYNSSRYHVSFHGDEQGDYQIWMEVYHE